MNSRLAPHHYDELHKGSGISPEVIEAAGIYTETSADGVQRIGFAPYQSRPGMVFPYPTVNGWPEGYVIKPDSPRTETRPSGKLRAVKYEPPEGSPNRIYCPPQVLPALNDTSKDLLITEGIKKTLKAITDGYDCIGLQGTWNWLGRHDTPFAVPLADWGYIDLRKRRVGLCFDSDIAENEGVRLACDRLAHLLIALGARVYLVPLPAAPDGSKQGLDDYLVNNPGADVWALARPWQEGQFEAMQRKLDEVQEELDALRDDYKWNRDLDSVPNKLLSGADKLALRDIRRATRRAGTAAYREPQTLFYGERTRHTGQSRAAYGTAIKRAEEMGAIKVVKGAYENGKPKVSVVLCDAFKQPAQLARPEASKAGGARPKNVPVCDGCGPTAGVREDKTTTTRYYCTGPDCGVLLHETTTAAARAHLVRDGSYPEDCYPEERPTPEPSVSNMKSKVDRGTPALSLRFKYESVPVSAAVPSPVRCTFSPFGCQCPHPDRCSEKGRCSP